ncbi:hypothetical protein TNCT_727111 [Trichonephila clavata]|uniref:Uncharacterized protein n=1 Tax=Trichonephila clavata TaxID=2740835 RepID=A0A8X6FVR3_TRICU|nr:hypothetical protein TNCT_727111 [Trichonephila clavata]
MHQVLSSPAAGRLHHARQGVLGEGSKSFKLLLAEQTHHRLALTGFLRSLGGRGSRGRLGLPGGPDECRSLEGALEPQSAGFYKRGRPNHALYKSVCHTCCRQQHIFCEHTFLETTCANEGGGNAGCGGEPLSLPGHASLSEVTSGESGIEMSPASTMSRMSGDCGDGGDRFFGGISQIVVTDEIMTGWPGDTEGESSATGRPAFGETQGASEWISVTAQEPRGTEQGSLGAKSENCVELQSGSVEGFGKVRSTFAER